MGLTKQTGGDGVVHRLPEGSRKTGVPVGGRLMSVQTHPVERRVEQSLRHGLGTRLSSQPLRDQPAMKGGVSDETVTQLPMRTYEGTDVVAPILQRGRRTGENRHDSGRVFRHDDAAELGSESGDPWLDRPGGIHLTAAEQHHELGIGGRNHLRVSSRKRDPETAGLQPGSGGNILRVTQLRRGQPTAAKILRRT